MIGDENKFNKEKVLRFLKKYSFAFVAAVLFIVLSVTLAVSVSNPQENDKNNNEKEPVDSSAITFYLPLLNATVSKDFSDTKLMYNETLKQWEAHKALDLVTTGNSNVYAALDGTVTNIYENYLEGKVIEIEHANNLKTIYKSLDSTSSLQVGDTVSKGQVIGTAGTSASEAHLGTHLHFEVEEDGKKIDPNGYLELTDK